MINKNKIVDSWLVMQTRNGNRGAMSLLVKRWHKKLCRHAYWYTKDPDIAQDIVQDCWPIIIKKIDNLKDAGSFGSWALSIVTRKAIDLLRKKNRELKNLEEYYDNNSIITYDSNINDSEGLKKAINEAIKKLPGQSQQVLNLFYQEELSMVTISEILNVPVGTIKSRLFNAREKLKTILKHRDYEK